MTRRADFTDERRELRRHARFCTLAALAYVALILLAWLALVVGRG